MTRSFSAETALMAERKVVGGDWLVREVEPSEVFITEEFSSEDQLIGKTAEDFVRNEVMPHVERIESGDHVLMQSLMQKAGALGLLGADVPEVYGGLGLKQTTAALIAEKLNPQQSFALTHEAHTVIATLPLLYFGNDDQKRRYLTRLASGEWIGCFALSEANSGSDALGMQARAALSPDGTHYLLNGVKMWITNTAFAQLFTVFAKVDGDKVTAFLVERDYPGVSFGKEEHKLGMHGTSTRRVILEDVRVPVENALEVGKGHYAALCALNLGRFKLEAGAVGGLKYLLGVCAAYAKQRKTFGRPIAEYGLIQHKLAEMAARTFALESMVYRLAGDLETAFDGIVPDAPDAAVHYHHAAEELALECNIVKVIGSEDYSRLADEAIQIHGGYGYTEEFPVARAWRDQRLLRIGEGANEIVRLAIINTLLRRDKQGRLAALAAGRATAQETFGGQESGVRGQGVEQKGRRGEGEKGSDTGEQVHDPLKAISAAADAAKRLGLYLLFLAVEQPGAELMEMQEVAAAIADVICSAYALESVWLRCRKLKASDSPRYGIALLAAQVAARDFGDESLLAADYVHDALGLNSGDSAQRIESLSEPLRLRHFNPMRLRRELAACVIDKDGYPL